jgi:hypothetical protein
MKRLYGHHTCSMCGKEPSIGWLYQCHQDRDLEQSELLNDPNSFPTVPNESNHFEVQAQLAEALGLKHEIVQGIRDGVYSFEQVDRLIEQKKHLLATIRKQENPTGGTTPKPAQIMPRGVAMVESIISSVGMSAGAPSEATATTAASPNESASGAHPSREKKLTCSFQVCHTCRPFFQDRLYMSFEQVFSGHMPAVTEEEIAQLPMFNAAIVQNLGLRIQTSPLPLTGTPGDLNIHQTDGPDEEDTTDWTPTSATITESDCEKADEPELHPCPGAGVCPVFSRYSGCAYESGFDDGLRALHHGFGPSPDLSRMTPENSASRLRRVRGSISDTPGGSTSTTSSISLPTPSTVPLTPITPVDESFEDSLMMRLAKPGKAATICGPLLEQKRQSGRYGLGLRGKDSNSSLGSEVEVEGGVALTEEAVETGVPDILTDDED